MKIEDLKGRGRVKIVLSTRRRRRRRRRRRIRIMIMIMMMKMKMPPLILSPIYTTCHKSLVLLLQQGLKLSHFQHHHDKLQRQSTSSNLALPPLHPTSSTRRRRRLLLALPTSFLTITCSSAFSPLLPSAAKEEEDDDDKGIIGAIGSLFDPDEKTKSGTVLPKAYLKSAREVVKTLRESLNAPSGDNAKFRRTAEAAKESIREYLGSWRGQQSVVQQESYILLEKAIRSLAKFYSRAGPSTPLSQEVKSEILDYLNTAEEFL
ncbi:hypothetical protein RIF29_23823 [Crotalaria pallida]|uniref:Uncharacterized protein n=1 Tax=Crotalaria pallida TaxID=3830 RepID=A0AAN9F5Z3_CROPI